MHSAQPSFLPAVVVIEDDRRTRQRLCDAITSQSDLLLAASFGEALPALEWIARHPVDILLTDLGLPDGSGIDVIRACANRYPACEIMVITMFGDDKNVLSSIEAGATGYILKDSDQFDVMQAMRDLRAGGSPMSPLIARKVLNRALQGAASPPSEPEKKAGMRECLTSREADILNLIARGYTYAETGQQLSITLSTVQTYIRSIYGKLAVNSRSQAVIEAHKLGLLEKDMFRK